MRTQTKIVEKINEANGMDDFFGAFRGDLVDFLTYEHAKPFLKEGATKKDWKPKKLTEKSIKAAVEDYMPSAWEKAKDMRGLSANRSKITCEHICG
jgi:hypothetical protein